MDWAAGRNLISMTGSGSSLTFAYNGSGLRTEKTVTQGRKTATTEYIWDGDRLAAQTGSEGTLVFRYDACGNVLGFATVNAAGTLAEYLYVKNLQGDVERVIDAAGNVVASYSYDAWGNLLSFSGSLAAVNPIRYRSYYYDSETALYYLQSRYYDPAVGRFLNADIYASTGQGIIGCNMFAYCLNNPCAYADSEGDLPEFIERMLRGGKIHRRIQTELAELGYSSEVYVTWSELLTGRKRFGRLDLCNLKTSYNFEIKPKTHSGITSAAVQMAKYNRSTIKKTGQKAKISTEKISEGTFVIEFMSSKYNVRYWKQSDGLILYETELLETEEQSVTISIPGHESIEIPIVIPDISISPLELAPVY